MGGASVAAGALKRAESRRASLPTRAIDDNGRRSCCDDVTPKLPFIRAHSHHFTMQTCFCTQLSYFMVVLLQYNECKRIKNLHESHFMTLNIHFISRIMQRAQTYSHLMKICWTLPQVRCGFNTTKKINTIEFELLFIKLQILLFSVVYFCKKTNKK